MSEKTAAAFHGVPCDGRCCTQTRHLGVCAHGRACAHHLREDARAARAERDADMAEALVRAARRGRAR